MPRRKAEDGGSAGLHHVLVVTPPTPAIERVVDLAAQDYDRERPEIPGDVHAERQALARQVLALTKRLDKAAVPTARRPATVAPALYGALRGVLEAVGTALGQVLDARVETKRLGADVDRQAAELRQLVRDLRASTKAALAPALGKLAKAGRAPSASPPLISKSGTKGGRQPRGPKSLGCAAPGCTAKPRWGLACVTHLKTLPVKLKAVVLSRGVRGPAKPDWHPAAAAARELLGRG
jgi:hypothetical protein